MEQLRVKAKKWGNSMGLVLPKKVVEKERIIEGMEIDLVIKPRRTMTVRELMDFSYSHPLPKLKKTTEEIMKEIDFELYGIKR